MNVLFKPCSVYREPDNLYALSAVSTHFNEGVWTNKESNTVGINKGNMRIAIAIGFTMAKINNEQVSAPPSIVVNDVIFVPVRFIAGALGYTVGRNIQSNSLAIDTIVLKQASYKVAAGDSLFNADGLIQESMQKQVKIAAGTS